MSLIKTKDEIEILKMGGTNLSYVLDLVKRHTKEGVTTKELDEVAENNIRGFGDTPSFLNYTPGGNTKPYPATLCVSVNEEIVHGVPSERVLQDGDIVGLDIGLIHRGLFLDMAVTVAVGKITDAEKKLIQKTKEALYKGISVARAGAHIGAIGNAIEEFITPYKYGIVRELGGHGVGHEVHEKPYIPNFGDKNTGIIIEAGMVLALEPMFTLGSPQIKTLKDRYTIVTKDKSKSAHFEHTIVITDAEPIIVTK